MKRLIIMRHSKSSWKGKDLPDIERPLNERGKKDARAAGQSLLKRKQIPDQILVSPSKRTRSTAKRIIEELNCGSDLIRIDDRIYQNKLNILLAVLKEIEDRFELVMLIGHNPSVTELSQYLSDEDVMDMPTSAIVAFDLNIHAWSDIEKAEPSLVYYELPKENDSSSDEVV